MKVSDAIVLGCMMGKLEGGSWNTCVLGVAANAVGIVKQFRMNFLGISTNVFRFRISGMEKTWPWLKDYPEDSLDPITWLNRISYRFECCVCPPDSDDPDPAKFEELLAYIRSIEPSCGDCNRFECSCVGLRIEEVPADTQKPLVLADRWANENVE